MKGSLKVLMRQIKAKSDAADALMAKVGGENRDMTPDEATQFDALVADVADLKTRVAAVEAADAGGDDEAEADPVRSTKVGVVSRSIQGAPAVHAGPKRRWSILRAMRCSLDGKFDGLEGEVHAETVRRAAGRVFKGIAIPTTDDPEIRAMMNPGRPERRDLTTVTGAAGIMARPEGFIDLLRANLVIEALGATMLTGCTGVFTMQRQTGANTLQWVGEGVSANPTNLALDAVPFVPKLAIATSVMTKQFLMQTNLDADQLTEDDLSAVCALGLDTAAFLGTGGAQPLGLCNNPGIPKLYAGGAGGNGAAFGYVLSTQMETAVANSKALKGKLAYVTNPTMRGALKVAPVGTAGYPLYVFGKGASAELGEINGYPAHVTPLLPNNMTKGTSSDCSPVIFGNFKDLVVAQWDTGLDLIVDVISGKRSGAVEITMEMGADVQVRHNESFVIVPDARPVAA